MINPFIYNNTTDYQIFWFISGDENLYADIITLESSRSIMELLKDFLKFSYPNEIGTGVYDIFSIVGIIG
ncbi:hypothetical protein [Blattabacterium punctulatus]|uniref:hypothetical protein n=1 Tax=Blattabacterium punctulatus TaxID=164514 RepID=UPI001F34F80E|nr:hypothetical protein [Blattabacterium punctulatus]